MTHWVVSTSVTFMNCAKKKEAETGSVSLS